MLPSPRVLIVTFHYPPEIGGVAEQTSLLAHGLAARGLPVKVVTTRPAGAAAQETRTGVHVTRLWTPEGGYRRRLYPWLPLLFGYLLGQRRSYDLIHIHQALYPAALAVLLGKLFRKKTVVIVEGVGASGNLATLRQLAFGWLARAIIFRADRLISLSKMMTEELLADGADLAKVVELRHGVDMRAWRDLRARAADAGTQNVVAVGRLSSEKGYDVLLRAWREVAQRFAGARLIMIGDGPERHSLEAMAVAGGSGSSVEFVGASREVGRYLAASAVYVLPSYGEGMSVSLLEAMAAGCTCLVSDIAPNLNLIEPGTNGLAFATGNSHDLADKLIWLLSDDRQRRHFGRMAQLTVIDQFAMETVARLYHELYIKLTQNSSSERHSDAIMTEGNSLDST